MPVPGGSGPYQPGKFYVPAAPVDAAAAPALGLDADSLLLAELTAALTAEAVGLETGIAAETLTLVTAALATDAASATELAAGTASLLPLETATVSEAPTVAAALLTGEPVVLTEAAVAVLGTVSQDVSDIEPLILAEIDALLADVGAFETGLLAEASDPAPPSPVLALPELVGYHVPGPLGEYRVVAPGEDEDTVLALTASAWLAWYD